MRVNNKTFEQLKMKVYSFSYQPLSMSSVIYQGDTDLNIVHGGFETVAKQMNLICMFKDKLSISKFIQNVTENVPSIIDIGDCYRYESYYKGSSNPVNEIWNGYYKVTFPFLVIQQSKNQRKMILTSLQNKILNNGTYKCPYIIEILPTLNLASFTVADYTVHNLKVNDKFVIDGVNKKVYDSSGNRFDDVEFSNNKFPFLNTGMNVINISRTTNVKVVIKYREVFI